MVAYNHYTDIPDDSPYSGFLGIHLSKASAERAAKRKADRRQFALDKIEARNAPKLELAKQGISAPSGIAQAFTSVGNIVSTLTGKSSPPINDDNSAASAGTIAQQAELEKLTATVKALTEGKKDVTQTAQQNLYNNGDAPLPDTSEKTKKTIFIIAGAIIFVALIIALAIPKKK